MKTNPKGRGRFALTFGAGLIMGLAICVFSTPVLATQAKSALNVTYRDIKIYVNGALKTPANEAFIVDSQGSTYVPLRFVSEALGYSVSWDDATSSVRIGESTGTTVTTPAAQGATVNGVVRNAAGNAAISGATVKLINSATGATVQTVTSGANGSYTMSNVAAGTYRIDISANGYAVAAVSAFTVGGTGTYSKSASLVTTSQGTVSGSVSDNGGWMIKGATVNLVNSAGQTASTTTTNGNGYYVITGIAAGNYTLQVSNPGHAMATVSQFSVSGTNAVTKDVRLASSYSSSGAATEDFSGTYTADERWDEHFVSKLTLTRTSAGAYSISGSIAKYDPYTDELVETLNVSGSITFSGNTGETSIAVAGHGSKNATMSVSGRALYVFCPDVYPYDLLDATFYK